MLNHLEVKGARSLDPIQPPLHGSPCDDGRIMRSVRLPGDGPPAEILKSKQVLPSRPPPLELE